MPYLITREDGGVSVMRMSRAMSDAEAEHEARRAALPSPAVSWRWVPEAVVPQRDEYRGAWVDTGKAIEHDMSKARELHRERLRRGRKPLLEALDVEYQQADEADDKARKRAVAARKQALRDAPASPAIEAATTIDELRAIGLPGASP